MQQIAVFVDAGYLFAAGAQLVAGAPQKRRDVTLDIDEAVSAIAKAARTAGNDCRLLRIYWYDGIALYSGPTAEQSSLAFAPNIKLRLGTINSRGEQKGVDSLIITDLIDLSRNKAITDALIVAGDEDLRVGVQVAQTYGVRVSLLGISPRRGNQSPQLSQEADAVLEWDFDTVQSFIRVQIQDPSEKMKVAPRLDKPKTEAERTVDFGRIYDDIMSRFDETQIGQLKDQLSTTNSLPRELDAPLIGRARDIMGRDLSVEEKRMARRFAREKLGS